MVDKPIIFSAPMVRALLDGRKTQTRRVLKPQPQYRDDAPTKLVWQIKKGRGIFNFDDDGFRRHAPALYHYAPGQRLYVREAFRGDKGYDAYPPREWSNWPVYYEADPDRDTREGMGADGKLRPSIHMPRWASRLTLTVTDVRVQRLQDIAYEDAMAEGCRHRFERTNEADDWFAFSDDLPWRADSPVDAFRDLWDSLHGPDAWAANPWVVAITFTVQRGNIDQVS